MNWKELKTNNIIANTSVLALSFAIVVNMFTTGIAQKIFYIVCYFSIFLILSSIYNKNLHPQRNKSALLFFSALLLLGIVQFIWGWHYSSQALKYTIPSENILLSYYTGGKRLILGSFLFLSIYLYRDTIKDKTIAYARLILVIGLAITLLYGFHEHFNTINKRIKLTADAASSSSYMIMLIYCVYLWLSQFNNSILSKILNISALIITFILLYLCGTRITILAFLIVTLFFYIKHNNFNLFKSKKKLVITCILTSIVLISTGDRWLQGFKNIEGYKNNTSTSLGARVAIWNSGINYFKKNMGFSSPDERTIFARKFINETHPGNRVAYKNVQYNMHNEFLESATLQGLYGLFALIILYFTVFINYIRTSEFDGVILPATSLFIIGLTDSALVYSQTTTLFVISLALCCIKTDMKEENVSS